VAARTRGDVRLELVARDDADATALRTAQQAELRARYGDAGRPAPGPGTCAGPADRRAQAAFGSAANVSVTSGPVSSSPPTVSAAASTSASASR